MAIKIVETKNYEEMSSRAAELIAAQILVKPECVLGLATGSTPEGTYEELVKKYNQESLDFSGVTSVNLDEYKGLPGDSEQSYRYFMDSHLFRHVNIDKSRTFVPDGMEPDSAKAGAAYDEIIRSVGGVDLQLLGIGGNGHIGFNEPGDTIEPGTHCVELAESTVAANARFFTSADEVPKSAYTMGIGTILQAKKILLLASGEAKAQAVYSSFFGPVTPLVPASLLQLHGNVVVIADADALSVAREKGVI